MKSHNFAVSFYWVSGASREAHNLEVEGKFYPAIPAVTSGPAENWSPPEGSEIEDVTIFLRRGKRRRQVPDDVVDRLLDDGKFYASVETAIDEVLLED